jgi:RHS repeat-associated protein
VVNPWRYAGQYQDISTGLYKMGARYYQPELGRWTQRDPLQRAVNPAQPPEAHPYLYVRANPINYVDPTGELSVAQECAASGLVVGAASAGAAFVGGGPVPAIAGAHSESPPAPGLVSLPTRNQNGAQEE